MEDREIVLLVESLIPPYTIPQCRICHEEEEFESCTKLEAPCACSGTVKFAHRECIQRWCNEKGNTTCEICLQKFQPGYTAPPQKAKVNDIAVTIRGSLEVPIQNQELHNPGLMAIVAVDTDNSRCSSVAERSSSCFRFVAITEVAHCFVGKMFSFHVFHEEDVYKEFTILLLVRHLLFVLTSGRDQYPFTLLTVMILRAGGILIPLYIMVRAIETIQNRLQQLHDDEETDETSILQREVEEHDPQYSTVQIHS